MFGKFIRDYIHQNRITSRQFAQITNKSDSCISNYIAGKSTLPRNLGGLIDSMIDFDLRAMDNTEEKETKKIQLRNKYLYQIVYGVSDG